MKKELLVSITTTILFDMIRDYYCHKFTPLKLSNEHFKISYDILNGSSFN